MQLIRKVLIANRGEIARRIIRTVRRMGLQSVTVYVPTDREMQYITDADEAVLLEGNSLEETFLNIDKIITVALSRDCDAIHPGYGFLSENPLFAQRCIERGLIWIGPSPTAMEKLSNKVEATKFASELGIPTIPMLQGEPDALKNEARKLNFPLLIKAASGGGGRGMKIVRKSEELEQQLFSAAFEAQTYFGNARLFVVPYFENVRHVEVQILADKHGHAVHLFDRECSIQRRYQKIIEEAPCVSVDSHIREKMFNDAVRLIETTGYDNVGTVEFIVLPTGEYFFLEVNTRIQVEHPVTESITGIDIVEWQIRSAQGEILPWEQSVITPKGHAIECRICAEDPANQFLPTGGTIQLVRLPEIPFVRIEADLQDSQEINTDFDSLLAKVIVKASDRNQAIEQMIETLNQTVILGAKTNLPLLRACINSDFFKKNQIHTTCLQQFLPQLIDSIDHDFSLNSTEMVLLATSAFVHFEHRIKTLSSPFAQIYGRWRMIYPLSMKIADKEIHIYYHYFSNSNNLSVNIGNQIFSINFEPTHSIPNSFDIRVNAKSSSDEALVYRVFYAFGPSGTLYLESKGRKGQAIILNRFLTTDERFLEKPVITTDNSRNISAPIPGKVVEILVSEGQKVKQGDILAVLESMKTENKLTAYDEGIVDGIHVKVGENVKANQVLFTISNN
ncbi:MAG: biotin/lipoyl-binding protein [Bacteroidales bacterium]|nr:biotin/lipoyl-binding protein [Bacteroidales bacterium]